MSRSEMADAVNRALDELYPDRKNLASYYVDARWIGKLERGEHRWASNERRAALRRVTGATTDHELGLHKPRHPERGVSVAILERTVPPVGSLPPDGLPGPQPIIAKEGSDREPVANHQDVGHRLVPGAAMLLTTPASPPSAMASDESLVEGVDAADGDWNSFSLVTSRLAEQRQAVAPEALLSLIEAHRDCLSTLFRRAGSDPVRTEIGAMLGEASIVASRLWSAQGNRSMALAHCAYARSLADRLGHPLLGATARIFESNLHSAASTLIEADGDIIIGLRLLEEALAASNYLSAPARARIAAEQAQAFAALHLSREVELALDRAREAAADIAPKDCTGLYSDWGTSRVHVYEGTCQFLLGHPAKAVMVLESVVDELRNDRRNTNVILAAKVDLASAYASVGQLEQCCSVLGDTYEQLRLVGNLRGLGRARRARQRLARWDSEPAVQQLDLRMDAA